MPGPYSISIRLIPLAFLLCLAVIPSHCRSAETPPPNVLFIAIDDLRNDLGILGAAHAQTPRLDAFASTARVFSHHYVQVPTCGASRGSLLRGRYPTQPAHLSNAAIARTHHEWGDGNLPAWYQRHGYRTFALGKITHHPGGRTGRLWAEGPEELPGSWTRSWIPDTPWGAPEHLMHGYANGRPRTRGQSPRTSPEVPPAVMTPTADREHAASPLPGRPSTARTPPTRMPGSPMKPSPRCASWRMRRSRGSLPLASSNPICHSPRRRVGSTGMIQRKFPC